MKRLFSIALWLVCLPVMAQITNVSLGAGPNSGTGDNLYTAFTKLNANDNYLATQIGGAVFFVNAGTGMTINTNGNAVTVNATGVTISNYTALATGTFFVTNTEKVTTSFIGGLAVTNVGASQMVGTDAGDNLTNVSPGAGLIASGGTWATNGGFSGTVRSGDGTVESNASVASGGALVLAPALANSVLANTNGTGAVPVYSQTPNLKGITLANITASDAVVTDAGNNLTNSVTTATELSYVHNVTSSIQTQLNGKDANGTNAALLNANQTFGGSNIFVGAALPGTTAFGNLTNGQNVNAIAGAFGSLTNTNNLGVGGYISSSGIFNSGPTTNEPLQIIANASGRTETNTSTSGEAAGSVLTSVGGTSAAVWSNTLSVNNVGTTGLTINGAGLGVGVYQSGTWRTTNSTSTNIQSMVDTNWSNYHGATFVIPNSNQVAGCSYIATINGNFFQASGSLDYDQRIGANDGTLNGLVIADSGSVATSSGGKAVEVNQATLVFDSSSTCHAYWNPRYPAVQDNVNTLATLTNTFTFTNTGGDLQWKLTWRSTTAVAAGHNIRFVKVEWIK